MYMTDDTNPELVNITLLHYVFRFRRLLWREDLTLRRDRNKTQDPIRQVLAHALFDVSGLPPKAIEEADRVISAIPEAIVSRVWKVYQGSFPPTRRFTTSNLYQAPEPSAHQYRVAEEDVVEENLHDRTIQDMESKYGKQEVAEEAELSRMILAAAQRDGRKFAPATPEGVKGG